MIPSRCRYIFFEYKPTQITSQKADSAATELTLLMAGGYTTAINKSEISSREELELSLMPENIAAQMSQQELVDLVEYLSTLE